VLPRLTPTNVTVTDRSDRMLVMEHELFRHFELEAFVPAAELRRAVPVIRAILEAFAGPPTRRRRSRRRSPRPGSATTCGGTAGRSRSTTRSPSARLLPDDTLISPAAGPGGPYYAVSFTTYALPPGPFLALAAVLARALTRLFRAGSTGGSTSP